MEPTCQGLKQHIWAQTAEHGIKRVRQEIQWIEHWIIYNHLIIGAKQTVNWYIVFTTLILVHTLFKAVDYLYGVYLINVCLRGPQETLWNSIISESFYITDKMHHKFR